MNAMVDWGYLSGMAGVRERSASSPEWITWLYQHRCISDICLASLIILQTTFNTNFYTPNL